MANKDNNFLNLLDVKKTEKTKTNKGVSIEDAVEINKDKYFEEDRIKKPKITFEYSNEINKNFQVLGSFTTEKTVAKYIRIPHEIDEEFSDFLGDKKNSKALVFLAYLGMQFLKEKDQKCKATYNES